jgi:cytochrome P450
MTNTMNKVRMGKRIPIPKDSLVYGLISDRRQQQESKKDKDYDDLLSRLMNAQDSSMAGSGTSNRATSNGKMPDKRVRDEVMTIFIAGHDLDIFSKS